MGRKKLWGTIMGVFLSVVLIGLAVMLGHAVWASRILKTRADELIGGDNRYG